MRQIARVVLVLCVAAVLGSEAGVSEVTVTTYGRGIQCDGFLLEWDEQSAAAVPGLRAAAWDASNTPRGLAGYVRVPSSDSCGTAVLRLTQPGGDPPWGLTIADSISEGEHYAAAVQGGWRVIEFQIPWTGLQVDSAHVYTVQLTLQDECGSGTWCLVGSSKTPLARVLTPKVVRRIVIVLVLLVAYAVLYIRLKMKRNRRTE